MTAPKCVAKYISLRLPLISMFGEEEFRQALSAYEAETSSRSSGEFTALRRGYRFFRDIRTREDVKEQLVSFIGIISGMDRDRHACRYVVQTFLMDFCGYLTKDFLFALTDHGEFTEMKEWVRRFTGEVYEIHKRFTQSVSLHSLEHLLEDYGTLLKFSRELSGGGGGGGSSGENLFSSFWGNDG